MEALFLKIVNMSLAATYLVGAVLILRLLPKAPKWILCALWGLVALRLLCPVTPESALSLIPNPEPLPKDILYTATPRVDFGLTGIDQPVNSALQESMTPASPGVSANPTQIWSFLLSRVWVLGAAGMLLYMLVSFWGIRHRVRASLPVEKGIRTSDWVDTPFVLGLLRPVIYLPTAMDPGDVPYVIAHERAHIRRHDHWWKPLGFALLSVYWFNPALWLAYILLCRDIEAACDEKVIREMTAEGRRAYSSALLHCSLRRGSIAACPLAFGETGVKARIRAVANYKKPGFRVVAAAVVLGIAVGVCFLTNPEAALKPQNITPQGMYLKCRGASRLEIAQCQLEYQADPGWEAVAMLGQQRGETVTFTPEKGGWQADWSENYGILLPGRYRLTLEGTDTKTGVRQTLNTEFSVKTGGVYLWHNTDDTYPHMPRKTEHSLRIPGPRGITLTEVDPQGKNSGLWNADTGENLFPGVLRSVALADQNGDGVCEVYAAIDGGKFYRVCCYDPADGKQWSLPNDGADLCTLTVRENRLFLVTRQMPENALYGVGACWELALTDTGLAIREPDSRAKALTTQLVEAETRNNRLVTLNHAQTLKLQSLLKDIQGRVRPASGETFARVLENGKNTYVIKLSYTLGYRVVDIAPECDLIWEDGAETAYEISNPEPLRSFLHNLTDGVNNRDTSGTPFAGEKEPGKWVSQIMPSAIRTARAYVNVEAEATDTGSYVSSVSGILNAQTLEEQLGILNAVSQGEITPGSQLESSSFLDVARPRDGLGGSIALLDEVNHLAVAIRRTEGKTEMLLTSQTEQFESRHGAYLENTRLWEIHNEKLDSFLEDFCRSPQVVVFADGGEQ